MIYRAIALSLAIMVGLGTIVPLATVQAEASSHSKQKRAKRYKKYSKKWWRAYHRKVNRRKVSNARLRLFRLRQIRFENAQKMSDGSSNVKQTKVALSNKKSTVEETAPAVLPSGDIAPQGWKRNTASMNEIQYRIDDDKGLNLGTAEISVVGPAVGADNNNNARNKTVGGVSTAALRRTVIDRMIKENGWVVNDYQKQIGGKEVYVVVAKSSGAGGAVESRTFYFTEADGRIYSVLTNAPDDNSKRLEAEAEKALNSLQRKANPTQQAELK
ncbi:MAG: hypothetical protein ACR2HG_09130 [Pyrinomonadaceae bacterium]